MSAWTSSREPIAFLLIGDTYVRVDAIESFAASPSTPFDRQPSVLVTTTSGTTFEEPRSSVKDFADRILAALQGKETY